MINVVSFSGGKTSAYLCHKIKQMESGGLLDNVHYVFMDTGAEHPNTYEFIRNCVNHFGIKLTCLRGNFKQPIGVGHTYDVVSVNEIGYDMVDGPYAQLMRKYGIPTVASAWCTNRMKEEVFRKYCDERFGKGNYQTWIGMRADEPKRVKLPNNKGIRYLAEISHFEKQDINDWWEGMPFNLGIEEHLGNCVFCFKKSNGKVALAARDEPDLLKDWERAIRVGNDRLNKPIEKVDENTGEVYIQDIPKGTMYRGGRTIGQVIQMFSDYSREELRSSLRSMKRYDSGSCSESCEAFGDVEQLDLDLD